METEGLILRTEGLVKRYGKRTVVNDVSFNVKQGEIVGLLGPNGAGKTTSFYMTTGLIVPNGGHIYLGDEDVTKYPVFRRARASGQEGGNPPFSQGKDAQNEHTDRHIAYPDDHGRQERYILRTHAGDDGLFVPVCGKSSYQLG